MSPSRDLLLAGRFARDLPRFLRHPVSLREARDTIARRRARRANDFLEVIRRGVHAHPPSPYRALLRRAGCEAGDLERLVRREGDGKVANADTPPDTLRVPNRAYYIDYQDCHCLGGRRMLCSGLNNYRLVADGPVFPLGGLEIVDLRTDQAVYQVPVELWSPSGKPMTQNPFWVEATESGLRAYFMPDDDNSTLFVYETAVR